jgi:hypothetical protein
LRVRQLLVGDCLSIIREGTRDIRALHDEKNLPLLHLITEARFDFNHASSRERNHRHRPRHVRRDRPGRYDLRRRGVVGRRRQRKLLWMVRLHQVDVFFVLRLSDRPCFRLRSLP